MITVKYRREMHQIGRKMINLLYTIYKRVRNSGWHQ